jgi:hypothetical protein
VGVKRLQRWPAGVLADRGSIPRARSFEVDFNLKRESPSQTYRLERDCFNLKQSRSKPSKRDQFVEATKEPLWEVGYEPMSPRDIQARSTAKPSSLYHHSPHKLATAANSWHPHSVLRIP